MLKNFFKSKSILQIFLASMIATLATAAIVSAATTIGTNISTDGALTVNGATTLGSASFSGNAGIGTTTPNWNLQIAGTRTSFPHIAWRDIIDFRNVQINEYSGLNKDWFGVLLKKTCPL